jgi:hypothetical protein
MNRRSLLLLVLLLPACDNNPATEAEDFDELAKMGEEIELIVADTECSGVEDCRYIGIGSKPCGGNWRFLVYSATATDTVALRVHVEAYNRREDQLNRKWGRMSDCAVPPAPILECVDARCVDVRGR